MLNGVPKDLAANGSALLVRTTSGEYKCGFFFMHGGPAAVQCSLKDRHAMHINRSSCGSWFGGLGGGGGWVAVVGGWVGGGGYAVLGHVCPGGGGGQGLVLVVVLVGRGGLWCGGLCSGGIFWGVLLLDAKAFRRGDSCAAWFSEIA